MTGGRKTSFRAAITTTDKRAASLSRYFDALHLVNLVRRETETLGSSRDLLSLTHYGLLSEFAGRLIQGAVKEHRDWLRVTRSESRVGTANTRHPTTRTVSWHFGST